MKIIDKEIYLKQQKKKRLGISVSVGMYAGYDLFDKLLGLEFNEYAIDDITWWLWEKNGDPEMKMWDKDGNEIPTETIEDLWEIVKDNRKQ